MIRLSHQTIELNPIHPFVIARGGYAHHRNVIIRLTDDDGLEGFGEAAPNRYYGESVSTVIAALGQFKPVLERADPFDLETTEANLNRVLRGNASAKSAVSAALHDMVGKKLGLTVYRLWGLDASRTPPQLSGIFPQSLPIGQARSGVQLGAPQTFGVPPPPQVLPGSHGGQSEMPPQPLPV